ncbi:MAG: SUMF1/EgtB/PvdO family nonheme iron enzyme, partial [Pyrinomonadaceae bacterium]
YVPGGEFTMGSDGGDAYERPPHKVTVKPFFIDAYEVTCEEYARFVKTIGRAPPPNWPGGQYPQGTARHPVTGVTWDDAVAYARWIGKRLPTEEEWEFAARGSDASLIYPWGREWKAGLANASNVSGGGLVDVGTFKGVSPFGAYDMVGNAWEWTASDLKPYPGGQLPVAPMGDLKVIRGGSWKERPEKATATYRGYLLARGSKDYSATGFRCAMEANALPASSNK